MSQLYPLYIKVRKLICTIRSSDWIDFISLQFRIANALFGMTLGGAAQHMQTEGLRARDLQEKALKHFEGKNAISTLLQLVGSLHLTYIPTVITTMYETIADQPANPLALKVNCRFQNNCFLNTHLLRWRCSV